MQQLIMLGTGNAAVTKCYNTCFAIKNNDKYLLVDAGGGNGILSQLEKVNISYNGINEIFVTHAHTDHILGVVWMIRMISQQIQKGLYEGKLRVYGHNLVIDVLTWICKNTLPKKITAQIGQGIELIEVKDGDSFIGAGMKVDCFDICSTKDKQFGCRVNLSDAKTLVCLGDEPFNESNIDYVKDCDWLLSEAFCLYEHKDIFKPYEKHHSTALDAGALAERLAVKNLVLYHTEDETIESRKQAYTKEAKENYTGNVFVPEDLEIIDL